MSLGLAVLEKKLFTRTRTRTPTPQSDDIMSAVVEIFYNLSLCSFKIQFITVKYLATLLGLNYGMITVMFH